jgi:outer membrane protein assembly factor BamB
VFDGSIIGSFNFRSVSTRGGGVWSALAGGLEGGVFATTGNTNRHDGAPEPADNHGLSLVRLDPNTGALQWKLQPVPYEEDGDPDWSAGATLMRTRCGPLVASTMKDGWAYAANAAAPLVTPWQFPPTAFPFFAGDPYTHGDTRYHRSGAAWRDTFVAMMGGHEVTTSVLAGYSRLHALDACAGDGGRVRWLADIPGIGTVTDPRATTMSPPSLSGGVVYVGTHQGHLVVLADPSVWPTPGLICVRPELTIAQCQALGLQLVPRPTLLADLALGQGEIIAEPALAQGRVYVATVGGRVLMLAPR